jgi:REP element-mobilizing transposase RayT
VSLLGRAQRLYPIRICGLAVLSSHVHLLLDVDTEAAEILRKA